MSEKKYCILCIFICIFLFAAKTSAGTLGDIKKRTGWQPSAHSQREDAYVPFITPAELVANLDKYYRDNIKMKVLFSKISTRGLNSCIKKKSCKKSWSSRRYIAFNVKDPQNRILSSSIYIFLAKSNPEKGTLLNLNPGEKITVTGFVKNIYRGRAWIEVKKIETGWAR